MKYFLLIFSLFLVSCGDESAELTAKLAPLRQEKADLETRLPAMQAQIDALTASTEALSKRDVELQQDITVLEAIKAGKKIRYVLKVNLRQIHYSLSIKKQVADMLNEEHFELITDKTGYDTAVIGQDLFDAWRMGSLIKLSVGSWRIKIEDKRVEIQP